MGRPTGGGGALFNLSKSGSGNVGTEIWVNLGVILAGRSNWIGSATWTSPSKATVFELRTNTSGKSTGTIANTSLLDSSAVRAGQSVNRDLYKGGALYITTVLGTGTEHWWLRITSKSATAGSYIYKVSYTEQ